MSEKTNFTFTNIATRFGKLGLFAWCFFVLIAVGVFSGVLEKLVVRTYAVSITSNPESELRIEARGWWPAQIGFRFTTRAAEFLSLEFSVSSTEPVEITNLPTGWTFEERQTQDPSYYYILIVPYSPGIEKTHSLKFADSEDNITTREIVITPQTPVATTGWPSPQYYLDADELITIVNREYRIPQDYIPTDLVFLTDSKIDVWYASTQLRKEAADNLAGMLKEVSDQGMEYMVTSGFRSFADQVRVYNQLVIGHFGDIGKTDELSARPGYSEHQLGTTIDITSSENRYQTDGFEFTSLSKWLVNNAHKYGFVLSYPEGATQETGFGYEPWHYRYIGIENVEEFRASNLSLNTWLMQENVEAGLLK